MLLQDTGHDESLRRDLSCAIVRLTWRLKRLDLDTLELSDYTRHCLGQRLNQLESVLAAHAHLLELALRNRSRPAEELSLVDYGGGTGCLAFLAKELGVGTVVYDDIDPVACQDVAVLGESLGVAPDHVVCGDVDHLVSTLSRWELSVDAVVSYDVIEHVYDVEEHYRQLGRLPGHRLRIIHGSEANAANTRHARRVSRQQVVIENEDREPPGFQGEPETLKAYVELRKDIISARAPQVQGDELDRLARRTRGLRKDDIETLVDEYVATGRLDYEPEHPTNTCDPLTGNWAEQLMDVSWLVSIAGRAGFQARIVPGRRASCGPLPKKLLKRPTNAIIDLLGQRGLFMAPYYVVHATRC
ncbi:MAG: methyltransferase domain-containing protein [Acidobacteriota bacterium]